MKQFPATYFRKYPTVTIDLELQLAGYHLTNRKINNKSIMLNTQHI